MQRSSKAIRSGRFTEWQGVWTLNSLVKGVGVEIGEMSVIGVFLAAMVPGDHVDCARRQERMGAIGTYGQLVVGSVLFVAALALEAYSAGRKSDGCVFATARFQSSNDGRRFGGRECVE